jgi:hypothetical protein
VTSPSYIMIPNEITVVVDLKYVLQVPVLICMSSCLAGLG